MQALCTEASLASLRRHYPQIYEADHKLALDPGAVAVQRADFLAAVGTITPASHRSAAANARCATLARGVCGCVCVCVGGGGATV